MSPDSPRWIIHADDFGETVEITDGIVEALRAGRVTSTSIMTNMPGTQYALDLAASWDGPASFGVHLNLCEGRPLTAAASLRNSDGQFWRKRQLFLRASTGRIDLRDLEIEIGAQIERVLDSGVNISHLDGHKHLHVLPVVREAATHCLKKYGIERARVSNNIIRGLKSAPVASSLGLVVRNYMSRRTRLVFEDRSIRSPMGIADIVCLMQDPQSVVRQLRQLDSLGVFEFFCHPGTAAADQNKPGSCSRHDELMYLLSDKFKNVLESYSIQLVTYWEI